jgi:protein-S-isoprenylcysteine O-methyltransferase Ste14
VFDFPTFKFAGIALAISGVGFFALLFARFRARVGIPLMYFFAYLVILNFATLIFQIHGLFSGSNYENFRHYLLPIYYVGSTIVALFQLVRLIAAAEVRRHEFFARSTICKLTVILKNSTSRPAPALREGSKIQTNPEISLLTAALSILVKFVFLPLISSWCIENIGNLIRLFHEYRPGFQAVNNIIVSTIFVIDTAIYTFGYSFESVKLDNKIRSVDRTFLGWLVCLWCYPPLNGFSFAWTASLLPLRLKVVLPVWALTAVLSLITLLWVIYVAASIALGARASNLTNRGTVDRFPYSIVRHPAYSSKNLVWTLQFIFFSQFALGTLLLSYLIYYLRAWTEEQHLSRDPEYSDYKSRVRWRLFPGVL